MGEHFGQLSHWPVSMGKELDPTPKNITIENRTRIQDSIVNKYFKCGIRGSHHFQ